jgi:hypothetical protein
MVEVERVVLWLSHPRLKVLWCWINDGAVCVTMSAMFQASSMAISRRRIQSSIPMIAVDELVAR